MAALIAIDPGVQKCGLAYFWRGELESARLLPTDDALEFARQRPSDITCEMPRTYGGRASGSADTNDLLRLALVVGRFAEVARASAKSFATYFPQQWKGQVPKDIMCRRIWRTLSASERSKVALPPASIARLDGEGKLAKGATDVLDAVGIGLHALGRFPR